ncbi:ribose-5-phosphate isomerase RpiA [Candidatus Bathyarchaeota archaeon]|jgi:ribose 5-phosphate isomerase A|nr:MAG: ribose-5-phosphate isomerase RpiA [Candidatus Bathyarchaeota archaeon]
MSWRQEAKIKAAEKVVEHIQSGMIIGIGSGSTAAEGIRLLGEKMRNGDLKGLMAVPTSYQAIQEAVKAQIPLTTLDEHPVLDFGFDGADQIDQELNAIKGGGGALLREKIVASCCKEYVLIADQTKITDVLGRDQPVYLEVHPMAVAPVCRKLRNMGAKPTIRQAVGKLGPVVTDNGNNLIDADFGPIHNPGYLNARLHSVQGVMETGLFIGYCKIAYIGTQNGVKTMTRF